VRGVERQTPQLAKSCGASAADRLNDSPDNVDSGLVDPDKLQDHYDDNHYSDNVEDVVHGVRCSLTVMLFSTFFTPAISLAMSPARSF
jgi:hypothetical protein